MSNLGSPPSISPSSVEFAIDTWPYTPARSSLSTSTRSPLRNGVRNRPRGSARIFSFRDVKAKLWGCKWCYARVLSIFDHRNFRVGGGTENLGMTRPQGWSGGNHCIDLYATSLQAPVLICPTTSTRPWLEGEGEWEWGLISERPTSGFWAFLVHANTEWSEILRDFCYT